MGLLNASLTVTVTAGDIDWPAPTFEGCVPNTTLDTPPAVTLNDDDDGVELSDPPEPIRVMPVAAVLIVMPVNVARPVPSVVADAPVLMTPVDGVSVTLTPLVGTLFPNES